MNRDAGAIFFPNSRRSRWVEALETGNTFLQELRIGGGGRIRLFYDS